MPPPDLLPDEVAPRPVRAELVAEDGTRLRVLSLYDLARLEEEGDEDTLAKVVVEYSDGERKRPYRFVSVGPVEFDGTTIRL